MPPPSTPAAFALDPLAMILAAGPVVRAVMAILALSIVATWTVLVAKSVELVRTGRRLRLAAVKLEPSETLAEGVGATEGLRVAQTLVLAAAAERERSRAAPHDREGIKERIVLRLQRLEAAEGRRMQQGTGILASIGATAPFVGLFGTVWGIMTSFGGIAAARATSLAVVAPGIAEALLATAMGLVAAIPAVVIYNYLARQVATCRALLGDLGALVAGIASRDLGREPEAA